MSGSQALVLDWMQFAGAAAGLLLAARLALRWVDQPVERIRLIQLAWAAALAYLGALAQQDGAMAVESRSDDDGLAPLSAGLPAPIDVTLEPAARVKVAVSLADAKEVRVEPSQIYLMLTRDGLPLQQAVLAELGTWEALLPAGRSKLAVYSPGSPRRRPRSSRSPRARSCMRQISRSGPRGWPGWWVSPLPSFSRSNARRRNRRCGWRT